jgi:hypothetical protein
LGGETKNNGEKGLVHFERFFPINPWIENFETLTSWEE